MSRSRPNELRRRLLAGAPLLLDGGLGTELIDRGLDSGMAPDMWNRARPQDVEAVHRAYVEAGSEVVHANSFGGNTVRLSAHGLAAERELLNQAAVQLARAAGAPFVLGDIGPTGEYLPPVGRGEVSRWRGAFGEQARVLAEAGVDGFHVETMSDLREALTALEALKAAAPHLPVLVSMTFEQRTRGYFTVMGDALRKSFTTLASAGADAVGANCTLTSAQLRGLAQEALAGTQVPLVLQPNAGTPSLQAGRPQYAQEPEDFAADMVALAALGVRAVGGCCGTRPAHIAALARRLRQEARA